MTLALLFALLFSPALAGDQFHDKDDNIGPVDPVLPEIINGTQATPEQWPETGALIAQGKGTFFGRPFEMTALMCSSTLIAPDVVLLAAHCVDREAIEATGGQLDELDFYWSKQIDLTAYAGGEANAVPIDAVHGWDAPMHPGWAGIAGVQVGIAINNDVALLFLNEAQLDVPYAYLITSDEGPQVVSDAPVTIVGWGHQQQIGQWEQPPPGSTGIKHVAETFIGAVGQTEIQIGRAAEEGRKCHGDSGGPTFMEVVTDSTVTTRLIGVTSHAFDETDCNEKGGVDTRVDFYLDWIDQEMRERCADGSRAWCDEPGIILPPEPKVDEPEDDIAKACGCQTGTTGSLLPLLLGGLVLGLRRRKR
ncbi:MAG: MYXO-CTERM domain-containing protein [Kiritimatiellia bacterium]|jgi:MYXO-CTERM domain-containing protein